MGAPGHQVSQVVQETFDTPQSRGSCAATRALSTCVVAAAGDNFGLGKVCNARDALGHVGKVYTGCRHDDVLQGMRCSPRYIDKFPLSTPEKFCNDATVSYFIWFSGCRITCKIQVYAGICDRALFTSRTSLFYLTYLRI